MKNILVGISVGIAASLAAFAVASTAYPSLSNHSTITALSSGSAISCVIGGVQVFNDTVPAGFTLTGQISYNGQLRSVPAQ